MKVIGSNITITDSVVNKMDILPLGNAEQNTIAYIDVGTWEQGGIDSNNGSNFVNNEAIRTVGYIEVKPNVLYNISRTIATSYMVFRFYNSSKQYLGHQGTSGMITTNQASNRMEAGISTMTMTINNTNVAYLRMVDNSNDLSTVYTISTQAPTPSYPQDIKVVTGDNQVVVSNSDNTQSQSYTLHLGSLELCKIGDYQDVITGSKDNWKVVRNVGKVILNGSENWLKQEATFRIDKNSLGITLISDSLNLICNQYKFQTATPTLSGQARVGQANLIFKYDDGSISLANFKTWLASNNIIIYYQLTTPTEETITEQSVINELNELQELLSYDGTTNITVTSEDTNAQMSVEVTYTSESDMNEKLTNIFNSIKSKLYHIIRSL